MTMLNPYRALLEILPQRPLQAGVVASTLNGVALVTLPGGDTISARGSASAGTRVFVRDGVIEGVAPNLPIEVIEL